MRCLQVFTGGVCYMFDTLGLSLDIWSELRSILEDQNITKSMHGCRQDSAALLNQ